MIKKILTISLLLIGFTACQKASVIQQNQELSNHKSPLGLPIAVSNNAVAYAQVGGRRQFYTFNGLKSGKTYQDITNQAFVWQSGNWQELTVPAAQLPVLASTAVTAGDHVYLFGGYTVAPDHTEKSVPNVWQINTTTHQWRAMPTMPTPVDDTVALVFQNRFIYLISGWHDVDNVDLVQVFDTEELIWHQATAFPLPPVFGHAGGIIENKMIVCDGVKVEWTGEQKQFLSSPACVMGQINKSDITQIDWQTIEHHSGIARYRMAATGDGQSQVLFMAGSDNPYNYNGIGYNKIPSEPSSEVRIYDIETHMWTTKESGLPATMDHRALLKTPDEFMILGGMLNEQQVTDQIFTYNK